MLGMFVVHNPVQLVKLMFTYCRRGAILSGAAAMNCGKVFTAEHGTKISIDLLAGVALGKGINLR